MTTVRKIYLNKWSRTRLMAENDWMDDLFSFSDEELAYICNEAPTWYVPY